jgi:NAD(P)-dependent dehydrogenase (short-subunit alcohol dehydrogenase family)
LEIKLKYYITGARRGLGKALADKYGNCSSLEECDVFINCKHDAFTQVDLLYKAVELGKRVINISSNSGDGIKSWTHPYAVQKNALDKANEQLYYAGHSTTSIRFGYFDSPRVAHVDENKMSIEYCVSVIDWVLNQPHRVKDITVTPSKEEK